MSQHSRFPAKSERVPIGTDGEGIDRRYILLAAATHDREVRRTIADEANGLTTRQCLQFLLALPQSRLTFGFAFSYDVNMILATLGKEDLRQIANTGKCYYDEFRIEHTPGKRLHVTDRELNRSITIWDMYPWVQSSFVKMLDDFSLAPDEVVARIALMKDQRQNFANVPFKQVTEYCLEECELLSRGVDHLLRLIRSTGYPCKQFYSPGSLAQSAMRSHHVERYKKHVPTERIAKASEEAYYGGRSEVNRVGHVEGPIYEYDIRSAYPYAATILPCFAHGSWIHLKELEPLSLVRVSWRNSNQSFWGPFPCRPSTGSLRYPYEGETWVWGYEALAGKGLCDEFKILEGYTWRPSCDHRPFAYLSDLYRARYRLKAAGNPQEYVYKLILNSTYGKVGERLHKNARREPEYRYLPFAGLITSITRSLLLEQIKYAGEDLLLCATDGILSKTPLDVRIGESLGEWETDSYDHLFIAGPGFYFADGEARAVQKIRNRGIARADVSYDRILDGWNKAGRDSEIVIHTRRFIGYRLALQRLNSEKLWRQFIDVPMVKTLSLEPRRRWATGDPFDGRSFAPSFRSHKKLERKDQALVDQLEFDLWNVAADKAKLERMGSVLSELDPWASFPAEEQPDWLIDELTNG